LEFFLKTATTAAHYSATFFPKDFDSNGFFSTSGAREELGQMLFWYVNNFTSSSPHYNAFLKRKLRSLDIYVCP
jgi:hypothetical protein